MTVDLSKAVKGSKVKFRCGGEAVLSSIENEGGDNSYRWRLCFAGSHYPAKELYQDAGTYRGHSVVDAFDIIAIEPPAFDWSTVKPGMAFTKHNEEGIYTYIGRGGPQHPKVFVFEQPEGKDTIYDSWRNPSTLFRRAPEHDIEVSA